MLIIEINKPTREEFLMWFKILDDMPHEEPIYKKDYRLSRKRWYENNRDKFKDYQKEYQKQYREKNKEHIKEIQRKWYANNKNR